jgi:hypothetical protein
MRDHAKRLDKLEEHSGVDRPYVVFGSTVIPEDHPVTNEVIDGWLRDGLANRMFGLSHVIHYHGGERDLTCEEWARKYQMTQAVSSSRTHQ